MKRPNYQPAAKNARAVCLVSSWLKAVDIQFFQSKVLGSDLTVQTADGKSLEVSIIAEDSRPPAEGAIVLNAKDIGGKNKGTAFSAFHRITRAAGYGMPTPVDRGEDPGRKLHYKDNFELVSMRHCEFRRVPNPDAETLKKYQVLIKKAAWAFLRWNSSQCARHGLEHDDLVQFASVWAVNYLGLYKVQNPTVNDNERKMYTHIMQRFGNFKDILDKKGRNCFPDRDTTRVGLYGDVFDMNLTYLDVAEEIEDEDYIERHRELENIKTEDSRRSSAAKLLKQYLSNLSHDDLLEALTNAASNSSFCPVTQKEARKQIRLHKSTCANCTPVSFPEEDEDFPAVDTVSATE